jgi:hypothetical protein
MAESTRFFAIKCYFTCSYTSFRIGVSQFCLNLPREFESSQLRSQLLSTANRSPKRSRCLKDGLYVMLIDLWLFNYALKENSWA